MSEICTCDKLFRLYKGVLLAVSDEKKIPGPPPDDFSKTTPNINLPDNAGGGQYDWDKTNYNSPRPNAPANGERPSPISGRSIPNTTITAKRRTRERRKSGG